MDQQERDFLVHLLQTYRIESNDLLQALTEGLLALEKHPSQIQEQELVETIFRAAHSLKSASRSVDFFATEKLCQALESVLSAWKQQDIASSPQLFDTFFEALDWIRHSILQSEFSEVPHDEVMLEALLAQLSELLHPSLPKSPIEPSSLSPRQDSTLEQPTPSIVVKDKDCAIRLSSVKLNHLLEQIEETVALKFMAKQRLQELKNIQAILVDWDKRQGPSSTLAHSTKDAGHSITKEINAYLQTGIKQASLDARLATHLVDQIVEGVKHLLLQPFANLFDLFPKMIRDISHSLHKDIHLECQGGEIEVDRRILEELRDPFTHLLRNSIDHGIELPEERIRKHKSPIGHLKIQAVHGNGQKVEILICDDGKGIDTDKIKQAALQQGIIKEQDWQKLSDEESINLIFQSGLSTSPTLSTLSGRGLGMGIVAEKIEKLGGSICVETQKDRGTTFHLTIPVNLAAFRGIHVKAAKRSFILSSHHIKKIIKLSPSAPISNSRQTIVFEQQELPYTELASFFSPSDHSPSFALIITAANKLVGLGVDEIWNEQEILVKHLGTQILHAQNIAAATMSESGQVIPILDPFDLVKSILKKSNG